MNVNVEQLAALQARQDRVRNLCIMAHVDHGKTSLSDHLIGSNGLIHPKLQGELRYLDSREDEQQRGITMKASSISLLYVPGSATRPEGPRSVTDEEKLSSGYLVNLIDSPGHVDFCSEVSTAARLSDGAVVVVDAVEGVRIQTHAVLRQAYEEKVTPCLFINKVDRLILELRMTPQEAAQRLIEIVTHANMVVSTFHSEKYMCEADSVLAYEGAVQQAAQDAESAAAAAAAEQEDEADAFQPTKCNVAFGSAHDGWAFRLDQFAGMYAEKLGCKPEALTRAMWGDWHFNAKEKRVVRIKRGDDKMKSMFVQFAIEPLWKAYSVCDSGTDVAGVLGAIVRSRNLGPQLAPRALEQSDPRQCLRAVLRAWLPLSEAVLGMAVAQLPGPAAAAPSRVPRLLGQAPGGPAAAGAAVDLPAPVAEQLARVERCLAESDASPSAPVVIYVSKMVAVPVSVLPRVPGEPPLSSNPDDEVFLAFGRVFSGTARPGQAVHVLSAAYSPEAPGSPHRSSAVLGPLYMMMGRALERLQCVPAGNVLAIAGLDAVVLKSATLSSTPACRPLAPMTFQAAPIVKVAVEPALPSEMPQLLEGLRLLNRADPFVEISVMPTGEHVLGAAGEVHLETCIKDLQERFARIKLSVSPPLVAFRETVACASETTTGQDGTGPETRGAGGNPGSGGAGAGTGPGSGTGRVIEATTPNGQFVVRVRASALPGSVASLLDEQGSALQRADGSNAAAGGGAHSAAPGAGAGDGVRGSGQLKERLEAAAVEAGGRCLAYLQEAWQLGPKGCGPNLLIARCGGGSSSSGAAAPASTASPSHAQAANGGAAPSPFGHGHGHGHGAGVRGGGGGASLFDVPTNLVVKAAKGGQQSLVPSGVAAAAAAATTGPGGGSGQDAAGVAGGPGAAHHVGGWGEEGEEGAAPAGRMWLNVPLGASGRQAATLLGFTRPQTPAAAAATKAGAAAAAAAVGAEEGVAEAAAVAPEVAAAGSEQDAGVAAPGLDHVFASIESGVSSGFQMATSAGPLCEEPMWGVVLELEARLSALVSEQGGPRVELQEEVYGPFSGQVMTAVAAACRRAVLEAEPRLTEALYLAQVQAGAEALSGVYAVLSRRRSRILSEEMREGSTVFTVHAYLPVAESFGLADEMRRRCSGAASVSLLLSHWERLQVDPFFVPTTEEEREEWGEEAVNMTNIARRLIDAVRRRKGLPVEEKVVKQATKQRTLKRNV